MNYAVKSLLMETGLKVTMENWGYPLMIAKMTNASLL